MSYSNDKELGRSPTNRKSNSIFPIQEASSPKIQLIRKNSDVEVASPLNGKSKKKNEDNIKETNNNEIDSNVHKNIQRSKTLKSKLPFKEFGRLDKYGYPILKGGKKHKISFREEMVKVVRVENWKMYNLDMSDGNNKNKCCIII